MTEERRYGINWVDLIIKVVLLILFVLLICWLFPMPKLDTFYDKVFNENIQTMKTAARDYYTVDRLPSSIGETKSMSLKQLVDNKLVLDFSDKNGNACDTANSYVQVTKTLDSEYALKVQLTCGDESDYIIDTIGCNGACLLSDVNTANTVAANNTTNDYDDEEYTEDIKLSSANNKNYSYTSKNNNSNTSTGSIVYYYPLSGSVSNGTNSTNNESTTTTKTVTKKTTIIKNNCGSCGDKENMNEQIRQINENHNSNRYYNNYNNGYNYNNSYNYGYNYNNSYNYNNNRTLYYEQAKIVTSYGSWNQGYKTGSNIQNKTEKVNYYYYTKNNTYSNNYNYSNTQNFEYRTSSYIFSNEYYPGKNYSYELQLTNLPSSTSNVSVVNTRYFVNSDYQAYINTRDVNLYMTGNNMSGNSYNTNANSFRNSSLTSAHFNYQVSQPYKTNGVWRVKVTIYITYKSSSVTPYYDSSLGRSLYYVPVYFKVSYNTNGNYNYNNGNYNNNSQRILDTEANAYKYPGYSRTYAYSDTVNYYRYINQYVDYNQTKWTTSRNVSGYQFTGNTRYQ